MQAALQSLAPYAPDITSVMHGGHVKDSAHYAGRAVDVGAFGGTPVGYNEQTWDIVQELIRSGSFQEIGTIAQIAKNKDMQALAAQYGVRLFYDQGSGPHVHLQVDQ